jgi:mono/diheme cytochrome c family protein
MPTRPFRDRTAVLPALFPLLVLGLAEASAAERGAAAQRQALTAQAQAAYEREVRPLLATYCVGCHGGGKTKGDLDLASYRTGAAAVGARSVWAKVATELHHGEMPPAKETKRPSAAEAEAISGWIAGLRRLDPPDPGRVTIRRLNRAEYNNTVRDLLGLDAKPAAGFPNDDVGDGFDNIAEVLSLSPLLMEKYLLAADAVLEQIVADDQVKFDHAASELPAIIDGKADPGKPLRTGLADKEALREARCRTLSLPGEIHTQFSVLKEGRFTIKVRAGAEQAGNEPARLAVKIDGQVVGELKVTAKARSPMTMTCSANLGPGSKRLSVIFLNPFTEPPADPKASPPKPVAGKAKEANGPRTRSVTIEAIDVAGPPGERTTDLHKRIFSAVPGKDLAPREAARQIAGRFATRTFRKPATAEQLELLLKVFDLAHSQGETFSESIKLMVKAALISPEFFYRLEEDQQGDADGVYRISAWELASRLSYFLWSSMPDDELFALAADGSLLDDHVLEAQVRRMIADPKGRALVDNFAGQWLRLRTIFEVTPDEKKFPELTGELRQAMYDEGALVFEAILREGRSLMEFIDTDFTFLNERLARHYGIAGVSGPQMRKVALGDRNRGGLITMGSLLVVTSNPTRTSPVKRGKWVLEEILGTPPPPPPPMVEALDKDDATATAGMTLRQRMERHRADPTCAGCHVVMDAIGFGLENFDAIGRWRDRDTDAGAAVDPAGELPGGQRFNGPAQLKRLFLVRRDDFARCLAEKLLTYALGRKLSFNDQDAIDGIVAATAKGGDRLDAMVVAIARSYPFRYRRLAK